MANRINSVTLPGAALFALALMLLAWSAYYAAQRLLPAWRTGDAIEASGTAVGSGDAITPGDYDLSQIVDAHLFGQAQKQAKVATTHAPETKLQINLLGLIASPDEAFARAIIGVGGAKVRPYGIGQTIEGTDASIHSVEQGRVLLQRGGALESLALKRKSIAEFGNSPGGADASPSTDRLEVESNETTAADGIQEQVRDGRMKLPF